MDPQFAERFGRKMCLTCAALIPGTASKCTVCGSFQNWRRHLPFDATILALLTALVSVIATSVPALTTWLEGGYSDVAVTYGHDDDSGGIFLSAYNGGNRPGGIKKITLFVPFVNSSYAKTFDEKPVPLKDVDKDKGQKNDEEYFLPPQSNKPIHVTFDLKGIPDNLTTTDFNGMCVITAEISEFSRQGSQSTEPPKKIPVDCKELSVLIHRDYPH
jgi:ribosomal protein L40E